MPRFKRGIQYAAADPFNRWCPEIGIGGSLATPPLPHHRTYGSRIRRFDRRLSELGCLNGRKAERFEYGVG
jgi:hypothetical protein